MTDWLKHLVADIDEPSEAAQRFMEHIERSECQWREASKSLTCSAAFEHSLKAMTEPSEAAKRFMEHIERSECQWREASKSLTCSAAFEHSLKAMTEPSEAAKRFMEHIESLARQVEEASKMFDSSWVKSLSEPSDAEKWLIKDMERRQSEVLKSFVPREPPRQRAFVDRVRDDTPPRPARRIGFHGWE